MYIPKCYWSLFDWCLDDLEWHVCVCVLIVLIVLIVLVGEGSTYSLPRSCIECIVFVLRKGRENTEGIFGCNWSSLFLFQFMYSRSYVCTIPTHQSSSSSSPFPILFCKITKVVNFLFVTSHRRFVNNTLPVGLKWYSNLKNFHWNKIG